MEYVTDLLIKRREEILKTMERSEPELVRELRDVDTAISGVLKDPRPITGPYTDKRAAVDAITAYLTDVGHPDAQENIVKALMDGGWAPFDKKRQANILDSIRYHVQRSKRLTLSEGRIGLSEWTEAK